MPDFSEWLKERDPECYHEVFEKLRGLANVGGRFDDLAGLAGKFARGKVLPAVMAASMSGIGMPGATPTKSEMPVISAPQKPLSTKRPFSDTLSAFAQKLAGNPGLQWNIDDIEDIQPDQELALPQKGREQAMGLKRAYGSAAGAPKDPSRKGVTVPRQPRLTPRMRAKLRRRA